MTQTAAPTDAFPRLATLGVHGLLISFADTLSEPANRAALAFRAAVDAAGWAEVEETSTSLASVFLRFDALSVSHGAIQDRVHGLLDGTDWYAAPFPKGRRLWRVPTVFGGDHGPQLEEAADLAGRSPEAAVDEIAAQQVRVLTIGFAPGQPYLGTLPEHWNLPRQTELSPSVPAGALVVAVRQLVLFSNVTPTGWRHIGQTAFRNFRPDHDPPFALRPGDEMRFEPVSASDFARLSEEDMGGARVESL